ncbi:hypothetical protein [Sphaerisporangium sp. NPDC051011]|uniref:hypothetical protein n=1 Tax=Sphaerisporangium sp. NPDC051011 TaxID=3155792 RepID=UPI00340E9A0C
MSDKTPNPALRQLDVLVGTWNVTTSDGGQGASDGQVTFEWMEGGFFLIQRFELGQVRGVEYIGHDEETGTLRSHVFSTAGDVLPYTWQVQNGTLTIWYDAPGSPAYFEGTFAEDGRSYAGAWHWPGGGYKATATRP